MAEEQNIEAQAVEEYRSLWREFDRQVRERHKNKPAPYEELVALARPLRKNVRNWIRKWRGPLRGVNRDIVVMPNGIDVEIHVFRPEGDPEMPKTDEAETLYDMKEREAGRPVDPRASGSAEALRAIREKGVLPAGRQLKERARRDANAYPDEEYDDREEVGAVRRSRSGAKKQKKGGDSARWPLTEITRQYGARHGEVLDAMTGKQREHFTLYHIRGMTMQEIAFMMGTDPPRVSELFDRIDKLYSDRGLPLPARRHEGPEHRPQQEPPDEDA